MLEQAFIYVISGMATFAVILSTPSIFAVVAGVIILYCTITIIDDLIEPKRVWDRVPDKMSRPEIDKLKSDLATRSEP